MFPSTQEEIRQKNQKKYLDEVYLKIFPITQEEIRQKEPKK